jgi:hypothetical protein
LPSLHPIKLFNRRILKVPFDCFFIVELKQKWHQRQKHCWHVFATKICPILYVCNWFYFVLAKFLTKRRCTPSVNNALTRGGRLVDWSHCPPMTSSVLHGGDHSFHMMHIILSTGALQNCNDIIIYPVLHSCFLWT